uniref:ATP-dependent Clp protease proteolytic subunit n=1 Tax=Dacrycarpus imbricatus TaxID=50181 RepID=A0A1Y1BDH7_9CONI|nr:ATP-dependent Clp protease proteolytic subunit [Dacrycarpus imbricatus]QHX99613.1 Clp protease proteolytic subunit [Dacrycarpus imbricatus]BAX56428.1 ATP-dependent Clp protease proteolytic subunit [Dacrycarpus imbricatus]
MPLGVPKVPHQHYEEEDAIWMDLYNKLYEERLLFLVKPLDDEIGNQLISMMVYLSLDDATQEQFLFIHCTGGPVIPGLAIYDTMQYIAPEVYTMVLGIAASMGSIILSGGYLGKRIAFPSATIMLHQPASTWTNGVSSRCIQNAEDLRMIRELIVEIYAERTKKEKCVIWNDLDRDHFMSAEETLEYGLVDLIIGKKRRAPSWLKKERKRGPIRRILHDEIASSGIRI